MALTGKIPFGLDYEAAEKFADEWAGDTGEYACVVEDFCCGGLMLVMDHEDALSYLPGHDAEIQYHADYSQGD